MKSEISIDEVISEILEREWIFFQMANNKGGRANCQDNKEEFIIMRKGQWETFSLEILQSYLEDLKKYEEIKINPVVEKYARMMEYSVPLEYEEIKKYLSPISEEKKNIVSIISKKYMKWEEEVKRKYPKLCKQGRPLYSSEDTENTTSIETYLKGELYSYSEKTLNLYNDYINEKIKNNENLAEKNLEKIIKSKGYRDLLEVEKKL